VVNKSSFDLLLDDLAKATSSYAADDDDGASLEDESDPMDAAILKILRRMTATIVTQGRAIRALQARPAARDGGQPAPLAKALRRTGLGAEEFMTKAMSAQAAGKITGRDVATAEQCINAGQQPPAEIVRAVVGANIGA